MAASDTTAAAPTPSLSTLLSGALPSVLSRARIITTPYPFKLAEDDSMRVVVLNAAASAVVNVQGRLVEPGQDPRPFNFVVTPTSNRAASTQDFVLNAGLVTNLTVFVSGATPLYGQTFVIIQLIRSTGLTAYVMGTLLAGYVTATQALGWPGSAIQNSVTDGGYYRVIRGTLPAAGAEIHETCPAGARWQIVGINLRLTPVNLGTTRYPQLFFNNGGFVAVVAQPASNLNDANAGNFLYSPNPLATSVLIGSTSSFLVPIASPVVLLAGDFFSTATQFLQAADQWSVPTYLVREWLEA